MDLQQFEKYINHPDLLDRESAGALQELLGHFPYFQTAHMLYLKNLHNLKDYRYESQLKKSSAYIADRKQLYLLIHDSEYIEKEIKQHSSIEEHVPEEVHDIEMPVAEEIKISEPPVPEEIRQEAEMQPLVPEPVMPLPEEGEIPEQVFVEEPQKASEEQPMETEPHDQIPTITDDIVQAEPEASEEPVAGLSEVKQTEEVEIMATEKEQTEVSEVPGEETPVEEIQIVAAHIPEPFREEQVHTEQTIQEEKVEDQLYIEMQELDIAGEAVAAHDEPEIPVQEVITQEEQATETIVQPEPETDFVPLAAEPEIPVFVKPLMPVTGKKRTLADEVLGKVSEIRKSRGDEDKKTESIADIILKKYREREEKTTVIQKKEEILPEEVHEEPLSESITKDIPAEEIPVAEEKPFIVEVVVMPEPEETIPETEPETVAGEIVMESLPEEEYPSEIIEEESSTAEEIADVIKPADLEEPPVSEEPAAVFIDDTSEPAGDDSGDTIRPDEYDRDIISHEEVPATDEKGEEIHEPPVVGDTIMEVPDIASAPVDLKEEISGVMEFMPDEKPVSEEDIVPEAMEAHMDSVADNMYELIQGTDTPEEEMAYPEGTFGFPENIISDESRHEDDVPVTEEKPEEEIFYEVPTGYTVENIPEQEPDADMFTDRTFSEWLDRFSLAPKTGQAGRLEPGEPKKKENDLIDRFLKTETRPVKQVDEPMPSVIKEPVESIEEIDDFITETLARIYIKQGYYKKARQAYEKLSLIYPEKNIYFAAQIKMLDEIINNK
ncbi:MAG: hypothetical protein ABIJ16_06245 [Bacteroidota bacterium]